jgi:aspartyl-tRNA(Asn)/glutamyl-tRNA(Gln) amidotransferase subunit A
LTIFLAQPEQPAPGIRLAVKDLFDTTGLETTYGSSVFAGHVPRETAAAVLLLEEAGYANVGKANLHEFAYGVSSQNPHYGTVPNPVAPGRLAGGSSGGSAAALAAGLADAALGTDSGGSIRIPAAWCGVAGLKPTYGLVSLDSCFPLAPSFDHAGPMARDVEGCERLLGALVPSFEPHAPVEPADLAVGVAWTELCDPLVRARVEQAAARFPHARRIDLPFPDGTDRLFMREVADVHRTLFEEHEDLYGDNVRTKVERCLRVTRAEADSAARERELYRERVDEATGGLDVLLVPTLAFVAPPADADELAIRASVIRFTYPFNVLGWPALALPCGPAEDGLPASVQLVGRSGGDALILAIGRTLASPD